MDNKIFKLLRYIHILDTMSLIGVTALLSLVASAAAQGFDASAPTNLAVYWVCILGLRSRTF